MPVRAQPVANCIRGWVMTLRSLLLFMRWLSSIEKPANRVDATSSSRFLLAGESGGDAASTLLCGAFQQSQIQLGAPACHAIALQRRRKPRAKAARRRWDLLCSFFYFLLSTSYLLLPLTCCHRTPPKHFGADIRPLFTIR